MCSQPEGTPSDPEQLFDCQPNGTPGTTPPQQGVPVLRAGRTAASIRHVARVGARRSDGFWAWSLPRRSVVPVGDGGDPRPIPGPAPFNVRSWRVGALSLSRLHCIQRAGAGKSSPRHAFSRGSVQRRRRGTTDQTTACCRAHRARHESSRGGMGREELGLALAGSWIDREGRHGDASYATRPERRLRRATRLELEPPTGSGHDSLELLAQIPVADRPSAPNGHVLPLDPHARPLLRGLLH